MSIPKDQIKHVSNYQISTLWRKNIRKRLRAMNTTLEQVCLINGLVYKYMNYKLRTGNPSLYTMTTFSNILNEPAWRLLHPDYPNIQE